MKTRIKELCNAVGIHTAYKLQIALPVSPSQAARLYNDRVEAISLSVLEKLCSALSASPNEILGYDANEQKAEKPTSDDIELIPAKEAAELLGVDTSTITRYVASGKIHGVKGNKSWSVSKADVLTLKSQKADSK